METSTHIWNLAGGPFRRTMWTTRGGAIFCHSPAWRLFQSRAARVCPCGLEFAGLSGSDLLFSMGNRVPAGEHHLEEIRTLATRLESRRSPRQVGSIRCTADSPKLGASQRCGCNSAFAGVAPGGLRPVSRRSLPALMLELKASAELHLPVQALDYWIP